jgi:hypothetical protein
LIVSTILMPLSFLPKKAEAQMSVAGYTAGLGPAIAKLPQCGGSALGAVKGLFSGIKSLLTNTLDESKIENDITDMGLGTAVNGEYGISDSLTNVSNSALNSVTSQKVSDKTAQDLLGKIAVSTAANAATDKANSDNATCIASIGRLIIKMLLQKLTVSTVNWIKSGFNGGPAFIQDPGKFFGNIAQNQVLQFGAEINGISPFSRDWIKNNALVFNKKFQDNARYSLNELIQQTNSAYSASTFQQDFSQGGWNAWTAMTQVPANNPLGFQIMADNEIQKRLAGTNQSIAQNTRDALQAANGFLGDERCTDDPNLTRAQETAALKKTPSVELCPSGWKYVTPGSIVAYEAQNVVGYQSASYFNVQDLNDAVAAITDALLSQFSSSIMTKGFANGDNLGADGTLYTSGSTSEPYRTQTQKDFIPSQLSNSWLAANPDFNIRTDLTQALIDEQRTYSDKLALQNKELNSTTDERPYRVNGSTITKADKTIVPISNAYGLMPVIYQLDYCIPGPHPGWEGDSRTTLHDVVIPSEQQQKTNTADTIAKSVVSAGLTFVPIVGSLLSSMFGGLMDSGDAKKASYNTRLTYANEFQTLTNYHLRTRNDMITATDLVDVNMTSADGLMQSLNTILNRYVDIMNKTYFSSPDYLPPVASEAAKDFNQLTGYTQMIKDNENKILSLKTTVSVLGDIKDAINKLNGDQKSGTIKDASGNIASDQNAAYNYQLQLQINAFGRVSADMVNGDDIANVDNLTKQIVDEKNYIYKNLLKGPYGCESWLSNSKNIINFPMIRSGVGESANNWDNYNVNSIKRMPYPFPILYDYNILAAKDTIPDPWNSGEPQTVMPDNDNSVYGPGFLSFVYFSNSCQDSDGCDGGSITSGAERLKIGDLVDTNGHETDISKYVTLNQFENSIGIY